jgi:hypothetical protein
MKMSDIEIDWDCDDAIGCDIAYRANYRVRKIMFRSKSNLISRVDGRHEYLGGIFTSSEWRFVHKPVQSVYTQEMRRDRELPDTGMIVMYEDKEYTCLTVIRRGERHVLTLESCESQVLIAIYFEEKKGEDFSYIFIQPIDTRTDKEKTFEAIQIKLNKSSGDVPDLIEDFIRGLIPNIKYTGDE